MKTDHELMQELFNTMWAGLSAQEWRQSINHFGDCCYRSGDRVKCAVGHCIPDDLYSACMEGKEVYRLVDEIPESKVRPDWMTRKGILDFLHEAQGCHDCASNREGMRQDFITLARKHGLTVPEQEPH